MGLNFSYIKNILPNVQAAVQSASSGNKVPIVDNARDHVKDAFAAAGMQFPPDMHSIHYYTWICHNQSANQLKHMHIPDRNLIF